MSSHIVMLPRYRDQLGAQLDLFAIGADGFAYTSWRIPGQEYTGLGNHWLPLGHPPCGPFVTGTALSVVSRTPTNLDVFAVGSDGRVYRNFWSEGAGWAADWNRQTWVNVSSAFDKRVVPGSQVVAVCRSPRHIDLFAVVNGEVWTAFFVADSVPFNGRWWPIGRPPSGPVHTGMSISAVASLDREHEIIVFASDYRESIWSRRWDGNWANWVRVVRFQPGSPFTNSSDRGIFRSPAACALTPVRTSQRCTVLGVFHSDAFTGGQIYYSNTNPTATDAWQQGWAACSPRGLSPGIPVTVVVEDAGDELLRLFVVNRSGNVATMTFDPTGINYRHSPWLEIGGGLKPDSRIAVVTVGQHIHSIVGLTPDGKVRTADINNGVPTPWRCIGGDVGIRFSVTGGAPAPVPPPAVSHVTAPTPVIQTPTSPLLDVISWRPQDGILTISGSGFLPGQSYTVHLNYWLSRPVPRVHNKPYLNIGRIEPDGTFRRELPGVLPFVEFKFEGQDFRIGSDGYILKVTVLCGRQSVEAVVPT